MTHRHARILLCIEFLILFAGMPALILYMRDRLLMFALLWGGAVAVWIFMRQRHKLTHAADWNWDGLRQGLRPVLVRFVIITALLTPIVWWWMPDRFLELPMQRPQMWFMIMMLYPLLSVWPQEVIYRAFLMRRYEPIFGTGKGYVIASALAFGYMHMIFLNPLPVLMTTAGGVLFARTYRDSRSLALTCLEHALYGCLIFTLGLGRFFYTGAAWQ
jgi:membrane protease YdiL (CAAX protease family)